MNFLICYATTEGQTRKIAQAVSETLIKGGHHASLVDAGIIDDLDIGSHDAVIMAGSIHVRRFQPALVHWITTCLADLKKVPTAFISVSLTAASDDPEDQEDAEFCVKQLMDETGWTPDLVHHAAGAFRYTQYDFFKRWAMRFIAMQKGAPTDTSQDYELTDWDALERFAGEFVEQVERMKAA